MKMKIKITVIYDFQIELKNIIYLEEYLSTKMATETLWKIIERFFFMSTLDFTSEIIKPVIYTTILIVRPVMLFGYLESGNIMGVGIYFLPTN